MPGVLDLSLSPAVLQPAAPKPVAPVAPRLRELLQQPGPSPRVGASSTSAPSPAIPKKITYEGRRRPWIQERTDAAGEVNGTTLIHRRRANEAYAYDILARNEQIPPIVEDPILRENFKATRKRYRTTKRNKKSGQSDRSEYTDAASKFQTARRALKIDNLKKSEIQREKIAINIGNKLTFNLTLPTSLRWCKNYGSNPIPRKITLVTVCTARSNCMSDSG